MTDHSTFAERFPIRFDGWYAGLSSALLLFPSSSYIEVTGDTVHVRMGWGFRTTFPKSAIVSIEPMEGSPMSRGVHGFAGRWLVNGSGDGLIVISLEPRQRAYVMGIPIRLSQLMISMVDPAAVESRLGPKSIRTK
jgi:hypothetical protein